MSKIQSAKRFLKDEVGATLVEYMVLVGLVAIVGIVAWTFFGGRVSTKISTQGDTINGLSDKAQ